MKDSKSSGHAVWEVRMMCGLSAFLLAPAFLLASAFVRAGVVYDLTASVQVSPAQVPFVIRYFVQRNEVRSEVQGGKVVRIFKGGAFYTLNAGARSIQTVPHATLADAYQKLEDAVKRAAAVAAQAPPDRRATMEQAAAILKEVAERARQGIPRDYRVTTRSESVGGHRCRVWEEYENSSKRSELCVAPASSIPGGREILQGMKTMSGYVHGSLFAIGIEYGSVYAWPDIERLGGVPLHVRQFQDGVPVTDFTLTGMRHATLSDSLFEIPPGYSAQQDPAGTP